MTTIYTIRGKVTKSCPICEILCTQKFVFRPLNRTFAAELQNNNNETNPILYTIYDSSSNRLTGTGSD